MSGNLSPCSPSRRQYEEDVYVSLMTMSVSECREIGRFLNYKYKHPPHFLSQPIADPAKEPARDLWRQMWEKMWNRFLFGSLNVSSSGWVPCATYILLDQAVILRQTWYYETKLSLRKWLFNDRNLFNPKTVIDIRIKGWVFGRDFLPNCTCLPASQNRNIKPEFCLQASLLFIFHLDVMILCQFSLLGFQIRIEWFSQLGALPLWHQRLIQKLQFPGERAWRNFIMRS